MTLGDKIYLVWTYFIAVPSFSYILYYNLFIDYHISKLLIFLVFWILNIYLTYDNIRLIYKTEHIYELEEKYE